MVWTHKENARKQVATKNPVMGTRKNTKEGTTRRKMDGQLDVVRRSMNYYKLRKEDKCEEVMSRNLILGEGNPSYNGQTLNKLMKNYVSKQTTSKLHVRQKH